MLELETKFELTEHEFQDLKTRGKVIETIIQTNTYYDDNWILADNSITLRVRSTTEEPEGLLTLKIPLEQHHNKRLMHEFEIMHFTDPPEMISVIADLPMACQHVLRPFNVNYVKNVGTLVNHRTVLMLSRDDYEAVLELDELTLPDGTKVFEVEIESSDESQQNRLTKFVLTIVPEAKPVYISKFQRFRRALLTST